MTITSPYLASTKELFPLSKGIPPVRTYLTEEYVQLTVYVDDRVSYISRVFPLSRFPVLSVRVRGDRYSRLRFMLTLESWRRGSVDIAHVRFHVPTIVIFKNGYISISFNKRGRDIPVAIRKARNRVSAIRKGRIARPGSSQRSSNLRPSPETYSRPYNSITEGNNGGYFLSSTPSSYVKYTRVWSGVRTPGFGKLPRSRLPVNPHNVRITEVNDGPGLYQSFIPSTGIYFNEFKLFTTKYGAPPDTFVHVGEVQFTALRRLIEKAQSGIEANLAQDFAQIGQTVNLIASTAKRLAKAVGQAKSGNLVGAAGGLWGGHMPRYRQGKPKFTKTLAHNWLELQYGWKPLLKDVHDGMDALIRFFLPASPYVQRVTASATQDRITESNIPWHRDSSKTAGKQTIFTVSRCKYMVRYSVDDKLKVFLSQTGFTNPVNLAWELLPFSFVADWFTPVGPFLEALRAWDGLRFWDGSVVLHSREVVNSAINFAGTTPTAPGQLFEDKARYNRVTMLFSRTKLNDFPSPYMPRGFKNGLASITHAENALALLRAAFK